MVSGPPSIMIHRSTIHFQNVSLLVTPPVKNCMVCKDMQNYYYLRITPYQEEVHWEEIIISLFVSSPPVRPLPQDSSW